MTEGLADAAARGDQAAYERLFARVAQRLLLYVRVRLGQALGGKLEAMDVVQEAYSEAHRSFPSFRPQGPGSFARWIQGIADHRLRDLAKWHGAAKRRPEAPLAHDSAALRELRADGESPSGISARRERSERLTTALLALEEEERRALVLRYFEERSQAGIAQELAMSETSARRLLGRARVKLGRILDERA